LCEAIDHAKSSVWVVVSFATFHFQFPQNRGNFIKVLNSAVDRGVDCRVLFWSNGAFFNQEQIPPSL